MASTKHTIVIEHYWVLRQLSTRTLFLTAAENLGNATCENCILSNLGFAELSCTFCCDLACYRHSWATALGKDQGGFSLWFLLVTEYICNLLLFKGCWPKTRTVLMTEWYASVWFTNHLVYLHTPCCCVLWALWLTVLLVWISLYCWSSSVSDVVAVAIHVLQHTKCHWLPR